MKLTEEDCLSLEIASIVALVNAAENVLGEMDDQQKASLAALLLGTFCAMAGTRKINDLDPAPQGHPLKLRERYMTMVKEHEASGKGST